MDNITIAGVQLIFCMCGSLERQCPYCDKIFQEDPHGPDKMINCIFCGMYTFPLDRIKQRSKEEIKAERK